MKNKKIVKKIKQLLHQINWQENDRVRLFSKKGDKFIPDCGVMKRAVRVFDPNNGVYER